MGEDLSGRTGQHPTDGKPCGGIRAFCSLHEGLLSKLLNISIPTRLTGRQAKAWPPARLGVVADHLVAIDLREASEVQLHMLLQKEAARQPLVRRLALDRFFV
jgi:hypothetical protein